MKYLFKFLSAIWSLFILSFVGLWFYTSDGGELPPIAQDYLITFQRFIEGFLSSEWFFVFFVVMWFIASFAIAAQSGWKNLAKYYGDERTTAHQGFKTGSGYIGKAKLKGILKVAADHSGLYLRIILPFKFGHKNLFIPWNEVATVNSSTKNVDLTLAKLPSQNITLYNAKHIKQHIPDSLIITGVNKA